MLAASPGSATTGGIGGNYCGTAFSGGRLVEVHTKLTLQADGLLTGTYEFADEHAGPGATTSGELQESMLQAERTRTLAWRDKYGMGLATFNFNQTGTEFTGSWGVGLETPSMQWDGEKCEVPAV